MALTFEFRRDINSWGIATALVYGLVWHTVRRDWMVLDLHNGEVFLPHSSVLRILPTIRSTGTRNFFITLPHTCLRRFSFCVQIILLKIMVIFTETNFLGIYIHYH